MGKSGDTISRRRFLISGAAIGAGLFGLSLLGRDGERRALKQFKPNQLKKGLAVVHGEDPGEMTQEAITALGGMDTLVSRGDVVVIKPNMAWDRPAELGANTNPDVVAALVEMCMDCGAGKVKVFDNTPSPNPRSSYEASGIAAAARRAGADVHFVRPGGFLVLPIPGGEALEEWAFYEEAVLADEVDVLINVPIAKHHSTSRLTMALKNVFGMVGWDRGRLHRDIHTKIADLNRALRIDLTVLDAYRIMTRKGPTGGLPEYLDESAENARRIIAGTDPVAVDSYGATLFGLRGEEIGFIRKAHEAGLGEIDYRKNGLMERNV